MTNEQDPQANQTRDITRRDTLRRLALLPIHALGLGALNVAPTWAPEDILTHCAAGITACGYLARGQYDDMTLAYSVLSTYLTPLKAIIDESPRHRKEAARLAAQTLHIKALLGVHREGPKRAGNYGRQALIYSEESGDVLLQLLILRRLAWIYFSDNQGRKSLKMALQAQDTLTRSKVPISPLIQSAVYSEVAPRQAQNGQENEALLVFHTACEKFPDDSSVNGGYPSILQFSYAELLEEGGLTYSHLGKYDEAFKLFSQIIHPETLVPKLPISSELIRVEVINRQALASLKRTNKDKELSINLWAAGIQGAAVLQSDQRFNEALTAYNVMEALWPGDKRIKELRDLTRHW